MNEKIVGTALYYLDSENITSSSLAFRTPTAESISSYDSKYAVDQDAYRWMQHVFGTKLGGTGDVWSQNYGSVATKPGRLLAFPNVL